MKAMTTEDIRAEIKSLEPQCDRLWEKVCTATRAKDKAVSDWEPKWKRLRELKAALEIVTGEPAKASKPNEPSDLEKDWA